MILILEDNPDRIRQFQNAVLRLSPSLQVRVWSSAHQMIRELVDTLEHATLLSLDHDLIQAPGASEDPGTGYDVTQFLEELIPCCPIIIHTSNAERGTWMEGSLTAAGWTYERVYPFGDDWIPVHWYEAARRLLADSE